MSIKHIIFSLSLLALSVNQIFAQEAPEPGWLKKADQGPASTLSRISVEGKNFVNESGEAIVFRGVNSSDPAKLYRDGKWEKAYFEEIKKWGATIVRFPVHPKDWRELGQDKYLALIDRGLKFADELGLYVIIDWHSIGNLRTGMFYKDSYKTDLSETYNFWRTIAERYNDNTTAAFYELFNEPTTFNNRLGTCNWSQWKEIMEEIITIIRANGSPAVPLVAGFNWGYDLTDVIEDPIRAEGIGYVSHPYPQKKAKPWEEKWTSDWGHVANKYPLILTEIGFCGADDPGAHVPVISDESYGDAITAYCKERGISYVVWVFDPDWSPMLFSDWSYSPTRFGKYFKKAMLTPQ